MRELIDWGGIERQTFQFQVRVHHRFVVKQIRFAELIEPPIGCGGDLLFS
jgi:hypothetical protein